MNPYKIPLTKPTGKIRIKERYAFSDYGIPIAPTQTIISPRHYIEWQIGYDRVVHKSEDHHFVGANGKTKQIYELSECLDSALQNQAININDILSLKKTITNYQVFIDERMQIIRTNFILESINNIEFLKSNVSYPLLIYKFCENDLLCEVIVREKQYAVGIMPMLYFCVPFSALKDASGRSFIGRHIQSNECGYLEIDKNIQIFMQIFRIFGFLSKTHQHDCVQILGYLCDRFSGAKM